MHILNLDVARLIDDYQIITRDHLGRSESDAPVIISFTHRPGVSNPLLDGSETQYDQTTGVRKFAEADFSIFNEDLRGTAFYDLYQALPFAAGRMRLRMLRPGKAMTVHSDSSPRAHVALITNPHCFLATGRGETHHVPADGNLYVFDTRLPHTAINASVEPRLHLAIALADEEIIADAGA